MGLTSHFNVWNTCLHILRVRGFALRVDGGLLPDGSYRPDATWIAEKDGFYFSADNPIELIGLVAVYDHVRPKKDVPYWWQANCPDLYGELMEERFPDRGGRA